MQGSNTMRNNVFSNETVNGASIGGALGQAKLVNQWPEIEPIKQALPYVPALPKELIPEPYRPWLLDIAHRMQCDRAFYLEAWNGTGDLHTDRIGRGSLYTENMCLSVFGGIQPTKLQ